MSRPSRRIDRGRRSGAVLATAGRGPQHSDDAGPASRGDATAARSSAAAPAGSESATASPSAGAGGRNRSPQQASQQWWLRI